MRRFEQPKHRAIKKVHMQKNYSFGKNIWFFVVPCGGLILASLTLGGPGFWFGTLAIGLINEYMRLMGGNKHLTTVFAGFLFGVWVAGWLIADWNWQLLVLSAITYYIVVKFVRKRM